MISCAISQAGGSDSLRPVQTVPGDTHRSATTRGIVIWNLFAPAPGRDRRQRTCRTCKNPDTARPTPITSTGRGAIPRLPDSRRGQVRRGRVQFSTARTVDRAWAERPGRPSSSTRGLTPAGDARRLRVEVSPWSRATSPGAGRDDRIEMTIVQCDHDSKESWLTMIVSRCRVER